jgi:hypothetical protein
VLHELIETVETDEAERLLDRVRGRERLRSAADEAQVPAAGLEPSASA